MNTQSQDLSGDSSVLIPRKVLFGNPDRVSPQLSPDGQKISFLAPVDGVLNVWVTSVADLITPWQWHCWSTEVPGFAPTGDLTLCSSC